MLNRSFVVIFIVHVISNACATAGPMSRGPSGRRDGDFGGSGCRRRGQPALYQTASARRRRSEGDRASEGRRTGSGRARPARIHAQRRTVGARPTRQGRCLPGASRCTGHVSKSLCSAGCRSGHDQRSAYVVGALPRAEALVALDAIAVTSLSAEGTSRRVGVLPSGPRMFVSGQADPDDDLIAATRKTLRSLGKTLGYLGLDISRVVRLKAFMQPMTAESAADVQREVSAAFGGKDVPPLSLVEWRLSPRQPIEIELVAAGREPIDVPVEYFTPPGLTPSPVFSRVARVSAGPLIYVSGLHGAADTSNTEQVEAIFATLTGVLAQAGSDLRHLVKATYYVSDVAASTALNELRPQYFEPSRPPAASKAFVKGVGLEGRTVTLDMIAVPARK